MVATARSGRLRDSDFRKNPAESTDAGLISRNMWRVHRSSGQLRYMDADLPTSIGLDDPEQLLTPAKVAAILGIAEETLTAWRCTGRQPLPFVKVGRLIRYRRADLTAYLLARMRRGGERTQVGV